MKFVIDDRLKHRATGVVVIVSILAIFLPDMMKKSNRRFEENLNISMRLPEKPALPNVDIPKSKDMFKTVKVAHVEITPALDAKDTPKIAQALPLANESLATKSVVAKIELPVTKSVVGPAQTKEPMAAKSGQYVVQLASFSQQKNAELLVNKLRSQGYKASYNKNGTLYKVIVGQGHEKDEAIHLQKKLSQLMQLNGFVVKTGVS